MNLFFIGSLLISNIETAHEAIIIKMWNKACFLVRQTSYRYFNKLDKTPQDTKLVTLER